jgi:hypothetical protein
MKRRIEKAVVASLGWPPKRQSRLPELETTMYKVMYAHAEAVMRGGFLDEGYVSK